jgi:hypothetical protein
MIIHTFTGSYSLFSKKAIKAAKAIIDVSPMHRVRFAITAPLTPFFSKDKLKIELRNMLLATLGRYAFGRAQVEVEIMSSPNFINHVHFTEGFWEAFSPPDDGSKGVVEIAQDFIDGKDEYFEPYVYKVMDRSVFMQWAMTQAFGTLTSQVKDINVSQTMTWHDFSDEERESWSMCPDCMPVGNSSCSFCEGTGIDTTSPGYNGPRLDVLLGQAKTS